MLARARRPPPQNQKCKSGTFKSGSESVADVAGVVAVELEGLARGRAGEGSLYSRSSSWTRLWSSAASFSAPASATVAMRGGSDPVVDVAGTSL